MGDDVKFEVWVSKEHLMTFDGTVVEVFGFVDVQRVHIAYRPEIIIGKSMVALQPEYGARLKFFYDKDRRAEIEAFGERLKALHPPRGSGAGFAG
jgi:hypothetical protein